MVRALMLLALLLLPCAALGGHCGQFFQHKQAVVVPVIAQPHVFYKAGADIEAEALAEKVARILREKVSLTQEAEAPPRPAVTALAQHCAKCHRGANAKAGLVYDGRTDLECFEVTKALRAIADGSMPKDHKLTPEEKGELMQELLDLERQPAARTEPEPELPGLE